MQRQKQSRISTGLLAWYDRNRRSFPWRTQPGETPDPYLVWLSEIMLQQTGTATVIDYFSRFSLRWPNLRALADAPLDQVLGEWAGLGYYARARNLHACAQTVSQKMAGVFPCNMDELLSLPGIGPYTASAIMAIAFNRPAPVLDGNIERVVSRLYAITAPLPASRSELRPLATALIDCARPGDMAQTLMDLGATTCTPRAPDCARCPLQKYCLAHAQDIAQSLPRKLPKPPLPTRVGAVFWLTRKDGAVLLRRRPVNGLLGGMMEFPGTPWQQTQTAIADFAPADCAWRALPGTVRHVFSHFKLELTVYAGGSGKAQTSDGVWAQPQSFRRFALPRLMQKVAAHAQDLEQAV